MRWLDGISDYGDEFKPTLKLLMDQETWRSMGLQRIGHD